VTNVSVVDNQVVRSGAALVTIDPREFELKVANTEAALRTAEVALETAKANEHNVRAALAVAQSNAHAAEIAYGKAGDDLKRDKSLVQGGAITQQQYDATKAAFDAAAAQMETARNQVEVVRAQIATAQTQVEAATSQIAQKKNDLQFAQLQLDYTHIAAPADGRVSKKNVEVGQLVQAGQPLMAIAEDSTVWVTANFKETQLNEIRVGEPVEIEVDGYPDTTFVGQVESISAATGAKFALLPPDNATGNFVKVTQRVPVRIALRNVPTAPYTLRPGMSANVIVTVQ
jgi:membrane fusion protein (multidrug efflux system)